MEPIEPDDPQTVYSNNLNWLDFNQLILEGLVQTAYTSDSRHNEQSRDHANLTVSYRDS